MKKATGIKLMSGALALTTAGTIALAKPAKALADKTKKPNSKIVEEDQTFFEEKTDEQILGQMIDKEELYMVKMPILPPHQQFDGDEELDLEDEELYGVQMPILPPHQQFDGDDELYMVKMPILPPHQQFDDDEELDLEDEELYGVQMPILPPHQQFDIVQDPTIVSEISPIHPETPIGFLYGVEEYEPAYRKIAVPNLKNKSYVKTLKK